MVYEKDGVEATLFSDTIKVTPDCTVDAVVCPNCSKIHLVFEDITDGYGFQMAPTDEEFDKVVMAVMELRKRRDGSQSH